MSYLCKYWPEAKNILLSWPCVQEYFSTFLYHQASAFVLLDAALFTLVIGELSWLPDESQFLYNAFTSFTRTLISIALIRSCAFTQRTFALITRANRERYVSGMGDSWPGVILPFGFAYWYQRALHSNSSKAKHEMTHDISSNSLIGNHCEQDFHCLF